MARILIVEDETVITMMLEAWLEDLGHQMVGPANNVPRALACVETQPFDAAVVDLSLGENRSYEIADALREKGIPFAWGTGYSSRDIHANYRTEPVISKPYSYDEFEATLAGLLAVSNAKA